MRNVVWHPYRLIEAGLCRPVQPSYLQKARIENRFCSVFPNLSRSAQSYSPQKVRQIRTLGIGVPLSDTQPQKAGSSDLQTKPGDRYNYKWSHRQGRERSKDFLDRSKGPVRPEKKPRRTNRPKQIADGKRMHSHLQFLTVPTVDTPGTGLVLHFDNKRYFFGQLHEGIQRATLQHGSKLLKVREFFLTGRTDLQTTGGLLGMVLTIADSAKSSLEAIKDVQQAKRNAALRRAEEEEMTNLQKVNDGLKSKPRKEKPSLGDAVLEPVVIHGGPNIMHSIAAARSFVFRQGWPMDVDEFVENTERSGPKLDRKPTWEDENIKVWSMPIVSTAKDDIHAMDGVEAHDKQNLSRKRSHEDYMKGQQESSKLSESHPKEPVPGQEEQIQQIREHVVHEMFKSTWSNDRLFKSKLANVNLPAKIYVDDSETGNIQPYTGPLPDGIHPVPNIDVLVREPWPGTLVPELPPAKRSTTALSYVLQVQEQRGKFMVQKAKDLKIPAGPLFSQLARGESVKLSDGRVINPDQVLEPGKPGGGVAIVDLPTRDYVADLVSRQEWSQEKVMLGVEAFVWILGPGVAQDERLMAFMNKFSHFQHVISSPDLCSNQLVMTSAASAAVRHHLIDPSRYSLLQHHNTPTPIDVGKDESSNRLVALPGLIVQLEPRVEIDKKEVYGPVNLVQGLDDIPRRVSKLAKEARRKIKAESASPSEDHKLPSPDAEIICLGTGSALPSLYRNVSGTLLRVPGKGSYIFDAGENTLGQLKRIYSPGELAEVLQDLKMIWISHLHADHHLGTASVIKAWYEEVHGGTNVRRHHSSTKISSTKISATEISKTLRDERRLFIVSSSLMLRWLKEYSSVEDFGYDKIVPLNAKPSKGKVPGSDQSNLYWGPMEVGFRTSHDPAIRSAMRAATGLENLAVCYVSHCHAAMAVSITFDDGFKFSYSGDCRPSHTLAAIGKGSTVLVHEATFDDEMQADAKAKKHSTISEAAGVGSEMGARRVILTHFSQRYQKIPTMGDLDGITVRLESAEAEDNGEPDGDQVEAFEVADTAIEADDNPNKYPAKNHNQHTPVQIRANNDMKIAVAFDYMRVKVKDIASLEHFTPALRELYKNEGVKAGDGSSKSARRGS